MIEYKIKESEGTTDPIDQVIVKTGDTVEFTLGNIEKDIVYLEKAKKELVGQIGIQEATKLNITNTHPHIAAMSQEDLTAAYLYRQATGTLNIANEKLAEVENMIASYDAEKVEIEKQTGLKVKNETTSNEEVSHIEEESPAKNEETPEGAGEAK